MIIARETVEEMFSQMRKNAPWNVDGELLWGYYFLSPDRSKLESLGQHLSGRGYRLVSLERDNRGGYRLHLERIEMHTAGSLTGRNAELHALGEQLGVEYDGMDVGAPPEGEGPNAAR